MLELFLDFLVFLIYLSVGLATLTALAVLVGGIIHFGTN